MTTWFVTRHPGALDWLHRQGLAADRMVPHIDTADVVAGDTVIGILPINLVAELTGRGIRYLHISVRLPPPLRGVELSAAELDVLGARLEGFAVWRLDAPAPANQVGDSSAL